MKGKQLDNVKPLFDSGNGQDTYENYDYYKFCVASVISHDWMYEKQSVLLSKIEALEDEIERVYEVKGFTNTQYDTLMHRLQTHKDFVLNDISE